MVGGADLNIPTLRPKMPASPRDSHSLLSLSDKLFVELFQRRPNQCEPSVNGPFGGEPRGWVCMDTLRRFPIYLNPHTGCISRPFDAFRNATSSAAQVTFMDDTADP